MTKISRWRLSKQDRVPVQKMTEKFPILFEEERRVLWEILS